MPEGETTEGKCPTETTLLSFVVAYTERKWISTLQYCWCAQHERELPWTRNFSTNLSIQITMAAVPGTLTAPST